MEMIERDAAWQTSGTPSFYELPKRRDTRPHIAFVTKVCASFYDQGRSLAEYFDRSDLLLLAEYQIHQSRVIGGIFRD
jgi:hypothetical protein